ncbi:MAG: SDR family NAD(P)-dependent oxidoreductase [Myxococcota bacterium]|nr:SDR family NAD(P)-dependent oxidoreductase [Myxococcota bacterium]
MDLRGKSAIVTGGGQGIGAAIAKKLGSLGANVAIIDYDRDTEAKALVADLVTMGVQGLAIKADVSSFADAQAAILTVLQTFGDLHILVCNAGINRDGVIWKMTEDQWDKVIDVNLKGCFNYARAAAPVFRKQAYGKIINITSINGLRGRFGQSNYTASKGGIIAFTKTLARELGNKNINVNAVAPGLIETHMVAQMPEAARQTSLREIVMGRLGQPEDIANAVAFFASDLSRHITGQVLNVDGGQLIA